MEVIMVDKIKNHYDTLLENGNDPFYDSDELKAYMDKWDGEAFIEALELDKNKTVLEIGIGTGRLAHRTAPFCKYMVGIDVSPKTAERCKENLADHANISIINADFMSHSFNEKFDVIYSALTFMHIENKRTAIEKVAALLNDGGRFVLSTDKNTDCYIDAGYSRIKVYPDNPEEICTLLSECGLSFGDHFETDFAHIFVAYKKVKNS